MIGPVIKTVLVAGLLLIPGQDNRPLGPDLYPAPGYELPDCDPAFNAPRFTLVLPDGQSLGMARLIYHPGIMMVEIIGDPRIFCSDFED